jgi:hypothetical protein
VRQHLTNKSFKSENSFSFFCTSSIRVTFSLQQAAFMAVPYASDLKEAPEPSGWSSSLTAAAFENRRVTTPSWLRSHFIHRYCITLPVFHRRNLHQLTHLLIFSTLNIYGLQPALPSGFAAAWP